MVDEASDEKDIILKKDFNTVFNRATLEFKDFQLFMACPELQKLKHYMNCRDFIKGCDGFILEITFKRSNEINYHGDVVQQCI